MGKSIDSSDRQMVNHTETTSEHIAAHIAKDEPLYLSVVVPVYNEEENVRPLFEKIQAVCVEIGMPYEVIFVDDGSRDDTFAVLSELHAAFSASARDVPPTRRGYFRVIRFEKNAGQTAAMAAGFEYARGECIVSMDGDLQNDPGDMTRLLRKLDQGYDVVCGWRKERQDKLWTRRVPSVAANWLIRNVMRVPLHDTGCSLKAYRATVIKQVPLYGEMHRFIPAMSLLALARITEVVVRHHPRRFGTSKYGLGRIWRVILDIIAFSFIMLGFAPRSLEELQIRATQRDKPKQIAWQFSACLGIPLLIFGGALVLKQDAIFMRTALISLGLGCSALGVGWLTARAIARAQQSETDLSRLTRFFIFFLCKRRPLRIFGPAGALMLVSSGLLLLLAWELLLYTIWLMGLVQILMHGGVLVFWFGMLGEFVAFANADKVKDYTVETFL